MINKKVIKFVMAFLLVATLFVGTQVLAVDPVKLKNPIAAENVPQIIGTIIKGVLGIMGGVVLLMVFWGASSWLLSAGNPEKIKSGSQTMMWALIGAIITVASYLILNPVLNVYFKRVQ